MSDHATPSELLVNSQEYLDEEQVEWLAPLSIVEMVLRRMAFWTNRIAMRLAFGVRNASVPQLPNVPFVLCPNHTSSLDVPAIAASLDYETIGRVRWAGRRGAVLRNPLRRLANRLAATVPVDRDLSALAVAGAILEQGDALGWFPEGTRTTTGDLQEFKPGIGLIVYHLRVPAVPVYIEGAYEAWPPNSKFPHRLGKVVVRFGEPFVPEEFLREEWDEETAVERLTAELRKRVRQLAEGPID